MYVSFFNQSLLLCEDDFATLLSYQVSGKINGGHNHCNSLDVITVRQAHCLKVVGVYPLSSTRMLNIASQGMDRQLVWEMVVLPLVDNDRSSTFTANLDYDISL